MIDLHTHTKLSDGEYDAVELVRRAEQRGYAVVALTDHADESDLEPIIQQIRKNVAEINTYANTKAICGIELTCVQPESIRPLVQRCRDLGAQIVNVHGETITENIPKGTNMAAIEAGVDILCHPGFITEKEAAYAAQKGVCLEITSRKGHCYTNAHVYRMAKAAGAKLVFNNDAHTQNDLISQELAEKIMRGCGILQDEISGIFTNSFSLARRIIQTVT